MVRNVGRSRACKTCRQRKVKCDQLSPQCTQCTIYGSKCPGPITGTIFIRVDPHAKKNEAASTILSSQKRDEIMVRSQTKLPSQYQPSRQSAFDQLFLSHFIHSFDNQDSLCAHLKSWYKILPDLLATSRHHADIFSIQAAAMIHYGIKTTDVSIQAQAYELYGKSLQRQRYLLQRGPIAMPSERQILTPVMLTIFETVAATSRTAWMQHLEAAASMVRIRGPENCRKGLVHLLFRTLRTSIAYVSVIARRPHVFGTKLWSTVPFETYPKTMMDSLFDVLLLVPNCLQDYKLLNNDCGLTEKDKEVIRARMLNTAAELLCQLKHWRLEFITKVVGETITVHISQHDITPASPEESQFDLFRLCKEATNQVIDGITLPLVATYHGIIVILYSLSAIASAQPSLYNKGLEYHTERIFFITRDMLATGSKNEVVLAMIFPLRVLRMWAVSEQHRKYSQDLLDQWGRQRAISGICA